MSLTRRDFLKFGGIAAIGLSSIGGLAQLAFAEGGEGDVYDDVPGDGTPSYYGFEWVWFDHGKFEDTATGKEYVPDQGWDGKSIDYFWNGPIANTFTATGRALFGNGINYSRFSGDKQLFIDAGNQALNEAKRRTGSSKARIVAFGWTCGYYTGEGGGVLGRAYMNGWSMGRTRDELLSRTSKSYTSRGGMYDGYVNFRYGNAISALGSGVANNGGWDEPVTIGGKNYASWRDYIWQVYLNGTNASQDNYVVVALAISDKEVPQTGELTLKKASADPSWTSAHTSIYSLAGAEYNVTDSTGKTVGKLTTKADGTANTISLNPGTYKVKETKPAPGFKLDTKEYSVTIESNKKSTVTSTDPLERGGVGLQKKDSAL